MAAIRRYMVVQTGPKSQAEGALLGTTHLLALGLRQTIKHQQVLQAYMLKTKF